MYKDKEAQKQADRERQRKRRAVLKGVTKGVTSEGVTPKGVTKNCPESVTLSDGQLWHPDPKYWQDKPVENESEYPAIVQALTDPIKRKRLESITRELKSRHVADCVRYGIDGPTIDIVGELLDCVG